MSQTSPLPRRVAGPSTPAERALAPDLGRGLMLALIAVANVMIYLVDRPYGYRQHIVEDGAIDQLVAILAVSLVDARAFPLFAFLFGYGIVQLSHRQRARGIAPGGIRRTLRRRHLALVVFGAVHAVLLFPGDILGLYGVLGLLVVVLLRRADRTLLTLGALWLVPASAVVGLTYSLPSDGGRSFFWSFEVADPGLALGLRALEWLMSPAGLLPVFTAALIGVVAARHRVLEWPREHRTLLRRVAVWGITLGVAGGLPSGLVVAGYLSVPEQPGAWLLAFVHSITGIAGGLGLAAVFGLLAARPSARERRRPVVEALAATGRRSLSAYLFQSVLFVAVLTLPFGGLGSQLGTAAAAGLALVVWAVSVLLAAALDRRSVRGPAEVLLRRWSYGTGNGAAPEQPGHCPHDDSGVTR